MLRSNNKAYKIAKKILNKKGVKVPPKNSMDKLKGKGPFLQK